MPLSKHARTKLSDLLQLMERRPWAEEEASSMLFLYNRVLRVWCLAS